MADPHTSPKRRNDKTVLIVDGDDAATENLPAKGSASAPDVVPPKQGDGKHADKVKKVRTFDGRDMTRDEIQDANLETYAGTEHKPRFLIGALGFKKEVDVEPSDNAQRSLAEQKNLQASVKQTKKLIDELYRRLGTVVEAYDQFIDAQLDSNHGVKNLTIETGSGRKVKLNMREFDKLAGLLDFAREGAKASGAQNPKHGEMLSNLNRVEEGYEYIKFLKNAIDNSLTGAPVKGNEIARNEWVDVTETNPDKRAALLKGRITKEVIEPDGKGTPQKKTKVLQRINEYKIDYALDALLRLEDALVELSARKQETLPSPVRPTMGNVADTIGVIRNQAKLVLAPESEAFQKLSEYTSRECCDERDRLMQSGLNPYSSGPAKG